MILHGKRISNVCSMAQLAVVDLPVPCPDLTLNMRSPRQIASRNSA